MEVEVSIGEKSANAVGSFREHFLSAYSFLRHCAEYCCEADVAPRSAAATFAFRELISSPLVTLRTENWGLGGRVWQVWGGRQCPVLQPLPSYSLRFSKFFLFTETWPRSVDSASSRRRADPGQTGVPLLSGGWVGHAALPPPLSVTLGLPELERQPLRLSPGLKGDQSSELKSLNLFASTTCETKFKTSNLFCKDWNCLP